MGYVRTGEDLPEGCPRCRYPTRREHNYCPSCGLNLRNVCVNCRAELEEDWRYCPECGVPTSEEVMLENLPPEPGEVLTETAEVHNTRGSDLYDNDNTEEAVREFTAAVSLAPTNVVYRTNLAVALSETGEYDRAIAEFREVLRLDPENVNAHLQMGYTYQEMGKRLEAEEAWQRVLELAPDSAEAEDAREALREL